MARLFILPYKAGSASAKALAERLGVRRLKLTGSSYVPRRGDIIVNWGNSDVEQTTYDAPQFFNPPTAISRASDKVRAFLSMQTGEVSIPDFTVERAVAQRWADAGSTVVVRHLTRGSEGRGIEIVNPNGHVPTAPLYVKYIKKQNEYRTHVFAGEVIDTQRKARRNDIPDSQVNWQVRNHNNGFIFAREGVQQDERRDQLAIAACQSLGLHFGAVDIIYNENSNNYYVLEVNTAPGLVGTTLENYAQKIEAIRGNNHG
jgi:glutathione synthase/RimK-type ligase-like ATP-grasp enzyme